MNKHIATATRIVDGIEVTKWTIQKYGDKKDTIHIRWTARYEESHGRGYTMREAIASVRKHLNRKPCEK